MRVLAAVAIIWSAALLARLAHLQIAKHDELQKRAERQQQVSAEISSVRGQIYDRNGNQLAGSAEVKSLYAQPPAITDRERTADALSQILKLDRSQIYERLASNRPLVAIKRHLSFQERAQIEALAMPGLQLISEDKRIYVNGSLAAHVLGFVDIDQNGKGGIELKYDELLRGSNGRMLASVDAFRKVYYRQVEGALPGAALRLTIDALIQHYAEEALSEAIRANGARGGTIILMRPSTGEILALANWPTFDPNYVSESDPKSRQNRAIELAFEPGSIMKVVTYGAALEEGLIKPSTLINCDGEFRLQNRIIRDRMGVMTASEALAKSSNVAAIRIAKMLGRQRLARYLELFGFGRRTAIELPAESKGILRDVSSWTEASMNAIPIGYEIGVTAIQLVAAFACIANDGEWVRPRLVSNIIWPDGRVLAERPQESRRVLSPQTALALKAMLENVVINGTGKLASIKNYSAAGKTGTAKKIDPQLGRYAARYVASFVGFAPVEDPQVACIVSIDEPKSKYYGGEVAAPVFARVVARALEIMSASPENRILEAPGAASPPPAEPQGTDLDVSDHTQKTVMPDLVGLSLRQALGLCADRGIKLLATGDGFVREQMPPPGAEIQKGGTCKVNLSRDGP
jgi:cell division protein FtsI/penicillin-binding protein 2